MVGQMQCFQIQGEEVTSGHDVVDLEVQEADREAELLHNAGEFPGRPA